MRSSSRSSESRPDRVQVLLHCPGLGGTRHGVVPDGSACRVGRQGRVSKKHDTGFCGTGRLADVAQAGWQPEGHASRPSGGVPNRRWLQPCRLALRTSAPPHVAFFRAPAYGDGYQEKPSGCPAQRVGWRLSRGWTWVACRRVPLASTGVAMATPACSLESFRSAEPRVVSFSKRVVARSVAPRKRSRFVSRGPGVRSPAARVTL